MVSSASMSRGGLAGGRAAAAEADCAGGDCAGGGWATGCAGGGSVAIGPGDDAADGSADAGAAGGWAAACAAGHRVGGGGVWGASAEMGSAGASCRGADVANVRRSSRRAAWADWARKKPMMPSTQPTMTSRPRRKKISIVAEGNRLVSGSRNSVVSQFENIKNATNQPDQEGIWLSNCWTSSSPHF